jgi:HD-GYP domain-containing protein (c-di-GMP phosphodiesterase class II)
MPSQSFFSINLTSFACGVRAPVDLFVGLADNKFVKVVRQGDEFDKDRLRNFQDRSVKEIFIAKNDFSVYVTYCLALLKRMNVANQTRQDCDFSLTGRIGEIVMSGLYSLGPSPEIGQQLTELNLSIMTAADKPSAFKLFLNDMLDIDTLVTRHSMATTILTYVLLRGMGWRTTKNIQAVTLAALVHDYTLFRFQDVYEKPRDQWSIEAEEAYSVHPQRTAAELLAKRIFDDDRVVRIVADHHELPDGTGFPNGLPLARIYPMALPLIMADRLSDILLSPQSPLHEMTLEAGVTYLKNREVKFYPVEYWDSLERAFNV